MQVLTSALMAASLVLAASGDEYATVPLTHLVDAGGICSLGVLPNGEIICVFFTSPEGAAQLGFQVAEPHAVFARVSSDSGKTWGPASLVMQSGPEGTMGDSTVVVARDKVFVIISVEVGPYPQVQRIHFYKVTSEDNGHTWAKPARIPLPRSRPAVSGRGAIALSDGTILVPYWWDFMAQTKAPMEMVGDIPCVSGVMITEDQGETWTLSTDVYGPWREQPQYVVTVDEPAIAAINDKDILMVLRTAMPDGRALECWSHDGGRSWGPVHSSVCRSFNSPSCLWRMRNGWIARMWCASGTADRYPLVVSISRNNGLIWSKPRVVVDFPAGSRFPIQASYPNIVEAPDGNLVAAWGQHNPDGAWLVVSARFTPEWVLGK